ncbi:MAG: ATP-binding protein [Gemmatimonadales bacterium]|nr:ATP-binding protein [Gemmatimonadales bacterium]
MIRTIVVISGKGGTGKTSVTASFAVLACDTLLADCDVDAANMHLVLQPEMLKKIPFTGSEVAEIDTGLCNSCGACAEACAYDVISPDPYVVDPMACEGCAVCPLVCPCEAISMRPEESGHWFVSETRAGKMVHARLHTGHENSGKLVTQVREVAAELAREEGLDQILVDGPPGIGCSLISAVTGADLAVVVTEPTVSGRHDLNRVLDLAEHFRLPVAVIINKWDLSETASDELTAGCRERGVQVVGRLPYAEEFVLAQRQGRSVVEKEGPEADALREIWNRIQEILISGK